MSSLFLDFPCSVAGEAKACRVAWCPSEPICAIATHDGRISFYLEEGVCLERCKIARKCECTALAWHPKNKMLATGWEDGHVAVHALSTSASQPAQAAASCCFASEAKHSRAPVRVALWNPSATRLVTGDASGSVIVWKAESRGGLALFKEYSVGSGVTCAVFTTMGLGAARAEVLAHAFSPAFFIGTRNGSVFYCDDLGHSTEVQGLGARVDHMLYYEAKGRLVLLTRALVLVQLRIEASGKVIPVMKMKVAVAGGASDRGVKHICWAGPGVVAAATGESLVRFWNLATDETFVISLVSAKLDRGARVTAVAFNPLQRYLAVGTREGKIAMWRFVGDYEAADAAESTSAATSAQDWESMPYSQACGGVGAIEILSWGPGQGLLAAASPDGATSLLSETKLHRLLRHDVGVIQLSTDTVRVERQNGASSLLTTDISIRGLAVSSRHVVAWNGQEARVYEWSEEMASAAPREVSRFSTSARAMALREETIFRAAGSNFVELCNLQGIVKQKIAFSEGEGAPTHLDVNGNFLAVATDTGLLKVLQVDRRDPKQLGSPGRFDLREQQRKTAALATSIQSQMALGKSAAVLAAVNRSKAQQSAQEKGHAITSIKVNADGTRISILADHVHGTSVRIREPDARLHVYDSDRDLVDSHDFGERGRFPTSHFWDPHEPKLLACETRAKRLSPTTTTTTTTAATAAAANGTQSAAATPYATLGLATGDAGEGALAQRDGETRSSVLQRKLAQKALEEAGPLLEVATLFVSADYGILLQDVFALEPPLEALLGVQVPRLFFTRAAAAAVAEDDLSKDALNSMLSGAAMSGVSSSSSSNAGHLEVGLCGRVMRDFVGLDDADLATRSALLDFSYYLTVGNMDEAHRAVRLIESPSVWENMAHMCVKTKRLDVAEVCLGHMGNARGAAAVRCAKLCVPELEARVAAVAIQLGLRNDAARLYRECGRHDLLNELYQAAGEWELALDCASSHDRIHLRSTHHRYARHLEQLGAYDGAARHYELADTQRREVPRMLVERGEQAALERYVVRSEDGELLKWWAGYCESLGHLDSATQCYERARDYYSLVRVACFADETERAAELVRESRSGAAAYTLARHLESKGDVHAAIQYFAKSGCYNHAIRLARAYTLDVDLMQFALEARPSLQVDCAAYFERKGEYEKAVTLYQKGGELAKALDLCFKVGGAGRAQQIFEVLAKVSNELDESSASPQVLARCADFFIEHGQYKEAVKLFVHGARYAQAIQLCVDRKVHITDDLAEDLTPPKGANDKGTADASQDTSSGGRNGADDAQDGPRASSSSSAPKQQAVSGTAAKKTRKAARELSQEERTDVLVELARACKKQGSFQLACKKFTQAGDRPRALKCLLKSGETKNIIYYASVSRHRDIYILAANYLQSLDWQSGTDAAAALTKKIVEFYTKARAHEQLAAFYDAYAQMEIDEFRDYEKALGALKESRAQLDKARKLTDRDRRLAALDSRVTIVTDFVESRRHEKTDPQKMATMVAALLEKRDVESAIRVGDAYALLVEYHYKANNPHDAFALVQQMRQRRIVLHPYLEQDLLEHIHRAVGADLPNDENAQQANPNDDNDAPPVNDDDAEINEDVDSDDAGPGGGPHK